MHVEDGKRGEPCQGNDFLEPLQLDEAQGGRADSMGGDFEIGTRTGRSPSSGTQRYTTRITPVPQMALPGESYAGVEAGQSSNGLLKRG